METLLDTLTQIGSNLWVIIVTLCDVLLSLSKLALRFIPLIAWVLWWSFAVDWTGLWPMVKRGAWLPMALLAVVACLVWSVADPPSDPSRTAVVNAATQKALVVAAFFGIALVCGVIQHYRRQNLALDAEQR